MQAGAHMVKLEGGGWTAETVRFLTERGVPCAPIWASRRRACMRWAATASRAATMPARNPAQHARELTQAGAAMLVLE
jgi:3-methyl-2-oxobutanoate hydroxymethyltransferase